MGKKTSILDALFVGVLLVVFGGIVLHAPLSVGLSTVFPEYELLIKSWKEILLGVALLLAVAILTIRKQWAIIQTKIIYLIALFAALNVLLVPAFYNGLEATLAGLLINILRVGIYSDSIVPAGVSAFLDYFRGGRATCSGVCNFASDGAATRFFEIPWLQRSNDCAIPDRRPKYGVHSY